MCTSASGDGRIMQTDTHSTCQQPAANDDCVCETTGTDHVTSYDAVGDSVEPSDTVGTTKSDNELALRDRS